MITAIVLSLEGSSATQANANYLTVTDGPTSGPGNGIHIPIDPTQSSEQINKSIADGVKADALETLGIQVHAVVFQPFQRFL